MQYIQYYVTTDYVIQKERITISIVQGWFEMKREKFAKQDAK